MNMMKRILALVLTLAVAVGALASCDMINPPADNRDPDVYTADVEIKFATNDDKMKSAIDAMNSTATILRNGDDISVVTNSVSGENSVTESYVLAGGVLFHGLSVKVGKYSLDEHKMAYVTESDFDTIIASIGQGADISADDFSSSSAVGSDVTYTDILEDSKASLVKIMSKSFESLGATVSIGNVSLTLTKDGDFVDTSVLSCEYNISLDGNNYSVTMRIYTEYNYTSEVTVGTPDDADKYQPTTLEEIFK